MEILFAFRPFFCFSKNHVRFYLTDIQYLAICQMLMKNSRLCSSEILFKFVALVVLHRFLSLFFFLSTIFFLLSFFSILLFYITPIEFIPETTSRNDARPVFISLIIGIPEYQSVLFASPRGIFISSSFNSGVWHFTDCVPATMAAVRGAARTPRVSPVTRADREPREISMAIKFHGRGGNSIVATVVRVEDTRLSRYHPANFSPASRIYDRSSSYRRELKCPSRRLALSSRESYLYMVLEHVM